MIAMVKSTQVHHRRLSVRVSRVTLAATAAVLVTAGLVLNVSMYLLARQSLLEEVTSDARLVAENTSAALAANDASQARSILSSLAGVSRIEAANLWALDGHLLAAYARHGGADKPIQARTHAGAGHVVENDRVVAWTPVETAEAYQLGELELVASLAPVNRQAAEFGVVTGLAVIGAMGMAVLLASGMRRDVRRAERNIEDLETIDPVTRLPNRRRAAEDLLRAVLDAREHGDIFALAVLDLDDFRALNDSIGYRAADLSLRILAERLREALPEKAKLYRMSGDEFAVLGPPGDVECRRMLQTLARPMKVNGREIVLQSSIGMAQYPRDAEDENGLLRCADIALRDAKGAGKNACVVYRPELERARTQEREADVSMRKAMAVGEFRVFYQPIVDMATGELAGAEALLRWQHPEKGLIGPGDFLAMAERCGLMIDIGAWVLLEVAAQLRDWAPILPPRFWVAVNVSPRQLKAGVLVRQIDEALVVAGNEGHRLQIEITEDTLIEDVNVGILQLQAVRDRGVRVAIDDFGTGHSSLSYLKRLPIDKFKIDRSFVRDLAEDRDDQAIVQAIVGISKALELPVVAEGVEHEAQRAALAAMGCTYAQGWLFGAAVPAASFVERHVPGLVVAP